MITMTTAAAKASIPAAVIRCAAGRRGAARGGASEAPSRAQLIHEGESTIGGE